MFRPFTVFVISLVTFLVAIWITYYFGLTPARSVAFANIAAIVASFAGVIGVISLTFGVVRALQERTRLDREGWKDHGDII